MQPVLPVSGTKDGLYQLKADVSGNKASEVGTFLVFGKEAAAAGRTRDAEVAFMMSCRLADQFKSEDSAEAADARYQLGRHYAQAAQGAPDARRAELGRRAELLYSESLRTYLTVHGQSHEKTRFAAEGLERLKQTVAQSQGATVSDRTSKRAPPAPAVVARAPAPVAPAPVARAPAPPAPAPAVVARAPAPVAQAAPPREVITRAEPLEPRIDDAPPRVRPSFDCSRARSRAERLICSDPELAQLDRDLGRLHSRVRDEVADPAGFRRRSEEQWRVRESVCRDKECLLDWYAERREQLLDERDARR
ncbi:MAG: hypothetical protein ABIR26_17145 [Ramlibacter sp.]